MRNTIRLSIVLAALAFSGCAVQPEEQGEEDFVSADAQAIKASTLYKALVGGYRGQHSALPTFFLNADRSFTLDTGIRCITTPCPSSESGVWSLWSYRGSIYLELDGKGTATRWFRVSGTLSAPTLVGVTQKGTWTKIEEKPEIVTCAAMLCAAPSTCIDTPDGGQCVTVDPAPTCAVMLCAPGTTCVEGPEGGKCVATPPKAGACELAKCAGGTVCEDTSGSAVCRPAVCPKESYVNCMPIVPKERVHLCSGAFHEWIKANCKTEFVY